jgi:hypothetical protein
MHTLRGAVGNQTAPGPHTYKRGDDVYKPMNRVVSQFEIDSVSPSLKPSESRPNKAAFFKEQFVTWLYPKT